MNRFFSSENIAMRFLTFLCDMMYINILFLLCSLPIFTIGASFTAMYSVIYKRQRHEDPPIAKTFFKEFRANFKRATLFWVPCALILAFLFADLMIIHHVIDKQYEVLQYPVAILMFLIISVMVFIFPQIAAFDNPPKQTLKNAALLSLANFPTTFFILIVHVALYLLGGLSPTMTFVVGSIMCFLGFATLAYFFAFFYRKIFNKILGGEEDIV